MMSNWLQRWTKGWRGVLLLCGLLALALVIAGLGMIKRAEREWKEAEEAYVAAGGTLDFLDLCPEPVPDEENFGAVPALKAMVGHLPEEITPELEAACEAMMEACFAGNSAQGHGEGVLTLGKKGRMYGEFKELDEVADFCEAVLGWEKGEGSVEERLWKALESKREFFEPFYAAVDRPYSQLVYDREAVAGYEMKLGLGMPYLKGIQATVRYQTLRAIVAMRLGKKREVLVSLRIIRNLKDITLTFPTLVHFLVSVTCDVISKEALWECIERDSIQNSNVFYELVGETNYTNEYMKAMRGEAIYFHDVVEFLLKAPRDNAVWFDFPSGMKVLPSLPGYYKYYLHGSGSYALKWHEQYILNMQESAHFENVKALEKGIMKLKNDKADWRKQAKSGLALVSLPAFDKVYKNGLLNQQEQKLAKVSHALHMLEIIPESLEFIEDIELKSCDFTQKPFAFQRQAKGFRLWSYGLNGKDDSQGKYLDWETQQDVKTSDPARDLVWSSVKKETRK